MDLERNIFKKSKFIEEKLISYGFIKDKNKFLYKSFIMDNSFQIELSISHNQEITGKIYDLSFGAEYTTFRQENTIGEFASTIRAKYEELLNDIKQKCTITENFTSAQANRLTELIREKYADLPEFLWEDTPDCGIFRNKTSNKWYSAILTVNITKICPSTSDKVVEIIDIKVKPETVTKLLEKPGYYPAYHMNKKNWLTVILDDSLSDTEIMQLIVEGYELTTKTKGRK